MFKKNIAKANKMIIDCVRDNIVLHVATLNIYKEMWDALVKLYENPSEK